MFLSNLGVVQRLSEHWEMGLQGRTAKYVRDKILAPLDNNVEELRSVVQAATATLTERKLSKSVTVF